MQLAHSRCAPIAPRRARGFTLVELAVVLAIVGLLLGMVLVPLGTQFELRLVREEQQNLSLIRDALLGFAVTQGRLPCPDSDGDGVENLVTGPPDSCSGTCTPGGVSLACQGELPFATLGIGVGDSWERHYLYEVDLDFIQATRPGEAAPNAGLDLLDVADITVRHRDESKATVNVANGGGTGGAAAIVVSLGSNGSGGTSVDGDTFPNPAAGTDERDNSDQSRTYTTRIRSEDQSGGACSDTAAGNFCEFDDMLIWLPGDVVVSRLVATGWLP